MRKLFTNTWILKITAVVFTAMVLPMNVWAAGPPAKSVFSNSMALTLLILISILLLAIALLAHVVIGAAQLRMERYRRERTEAANLSSGNPAAKLTTVVILCLLSTSVFAQSTGAEAAPEVVITTIAGLSKTVFYALVSVIAIELGIIVWMLWFLRSLIAKEVVAISVKKQKVAKERIWKNWWIKINSFRSMSEEKDIDLGHEYDDIRELDNRLPPWWIYGFYITIIFAAVYLWRYHVSHSAPSPHEEYEIAMAKAEEEKASNLKKAGNTVDENTVKYLSTSTDLEAGKKIYIASCAACHAADGGGIVGPNLTDDYWLHGGGIKDVFKTIKYGVPEKGMQPWKGTFSPMQIAQLTSYIKSIKGTKVANPKEPQGDLYTEEATISDSTRIAAVKQP